MNRTKLIACGMLAATLVIGPSAALALRAKPKGLHAAARRQDAAAVERLLREGHRVDACDAEGQTAPAPAAAGVAGTDGIRLAPQALLARPSMGAP